MVSKKSVFWLALLAVCALGAKAYADPYADLIAACVKGDLAGAQAAIASGADVNKLDASGNPPLTTAIFWPEIVSALLDAGADPNRGALTPLYNAASNGSTETVRLLLAKGAKPDGGGSALEASIKGTNNADVARLLIEAGAKVDYINADGQNLIYVWADSPNFQDKINGAKYIVKVLEDPKYGYRLPDWYRTQDASVNQAPAEVLKLLVAAGLDINKPAAKFPVIGWTPLLATLRVDRPEKALALVAAGADVRTPIAIKEPKLSYHPICLAAELGRLELVKLMVAKGADINVQAENSALLGNSGFTGCKGLTPLNIAFMFGFYDIARFLIDSGADVTIGISGTVFTPLNLLGGKSEPVRQVINGKSALYYAIETGDVALVTLVAERLGWKVPPKYSVDAPPTTVVTATGDRYSVTFKKLSLTPSAYAERLGLKDLAAMLKAKKM